MMMESIVFFFFSSRRRHTRSLRDWSSDVCSSDLTPDSGPLAYVPGSQHLPWYEFEPGSVVRSEERRVGKECRSRWSPYHSKTTEAAASIAAPKNLRRVKSDSISFFVNGPTALFAASEFFFFSSRRRHTRSLRDWSSACALPISGMPIWLPPGAATNDTPGYPYSVHAAPEIGRASCRERVSISVVAVSLKKK